MKMRQYPFVIFCSLCLAVGTASAQVIINKADVKKILLSNSVGGLGGGYDVTAEMLPQNGEWNSYQTDSVVYSIRQVAKYHSFKRKQIAVVPASAVATFISALSSIKPDFEPDAFGINPAMLRAGLQIKGKPSPGEPDFDKLVTPKTIAAGLDKIAHQQTSIMDYGTYCAILIIKTNGDTVKVTSQSHDFAMLPWQLGRKQTYDIRISQFFELAMGKADFPSRYNAFDVVWDALGTANPSLKNYCWNYGYPDNKALLKSGFKIRNVNINDPEPPFTYVGKVSCSLTSADLGKNMVIGAVVDISSKEKIEKLLAFKANIVKMQQAGNFLFNYYACIAGADINILVPDAHTNVSDVGAVLYKQIPEAAQYNKLALIDVFTHTPDGSAVWTLMPDGRVILLSIPTETKPQALPPEVLKAVDFQKFGQYQNFALFSQQGVRLK